MLKYKILLFVFAGTIGVSCKKDWMEAKSNKSLDVPTTVKEFQAMLDHSVYMNDGRPALGEESADNYYVSSAMWAGYSASERNTYIWDKDIYIDVDADPNNWNTAYRQVFCSNVILDDIDKVTEADKGTPAWNNVKGSAHFFRGEAFFNVSQIYAMPYKAGSVNEPGIPLRLNADPNIRSVRSGLGETYQQILNDLHTAVNYLPVTPLYKTRPSKPAAYALLSRVYLVMQDYPRALSYADSCLKLYDSLIDYNTLNSNAAYPVPGLNKEVIFHASMSNYFYANTVIIDSNFYKSYNVNDLRQKVFFKSNVNGGVRFVGTYTGGNTGQIFFAGIATDEVFLTRAECLARTGDFTAAMDDLNALLMKRYKAGTFVPLTANNASEALDLILEERRKETLFRGLRWPDIRRLNSEGANIVLTRVVENQTYTLQPNSPRYALPLPPDVIILSGMPQNDR